MLATKINNKLFTGLTCLLVIPLLFSCRKAVELDVPSQWMVTSSAFSDASGATAAVYGMYDLKRSLFAPRTSSNPDLPKVNAFYSDEYISAFNTDYYLNALTPRSSVSVLWQNAYQVIFRANSIIEGIEKYGKNLPDTLQNQFTGEAKFIRAWANFVQVNLYGDVPLLLTSDHNVNRLSSRSPQAAVYQQILSDLLSAKELVSDYYLNKSNQLAASTERVRANKNVVTAFLAKVYLYMGEWQKAEAMASEVLNKTATYSLNNNLTAVFDNNSPENILQVFEFQYYASISFDLTAGNPGSGLRLGYLSDSVLNKYEAGDKRRTDWIGTRTSGTNTWYFPKKYKSSALNLATTTDYVAAMRLAELYLIRAEARIQQNNIAAGIGDLNKLRQRARGAATTAVPNPLPDLLPTLSKTDAMLALEKEWTREMFMEGHRWFNLKRWKGISNPAISRADELMPSIAAAKGVSWESYKKLFPIPQKEMDMNPNMVQNPGYN